MQIQPNIYRYFLKDNSGNYLSWVNGALVSSSTKTPLQFSPDGWMDESIQYKRDENVHGIARTLSLPQRFVRDGAKILKYKYYNEGSESIVKVVVEKNNTDTYQYEDYFNQDMEIDFTNFKDGLEFVEVNIVEGGLSKYLKAGKGTTFEIPLEVPQAKALFCDGLFLHDKANFDIMQEHYAVGRNYFYCGMIFLNNEGSSTGINYYNVIGSVVNNPDFNSLNYFFSTEVDVTVHFKFTLKFNISSHVGSNNLKFQLHTQTRIYPLLEITVNSNGYHEFPFEFDWTVLAGEHVFLFGDPNGRGLVIDVQTSDFVMTFKTRKTATTFLCHTPLYVFKYLINKITEGKCPADSIFLSNLDNSVFLTSGDGIRGLTGSVIKTSLTDFLRSFDCVYCLGMGEDTGTAIIERRENFYLKDIEITDIGEVKDLEVTNATPLINNLIKVGYSDQKYDERNGKDEFNTAVEFSTPVKRVAKVYDLISTYRADMYGIELTRINLEGKTTTDNEADNSVFLIHVTPQTTWNATTPGSQIARLSPLTVSAALNERKLILFTNNGVPFITSDHILFTYLGLPLFATFNFSITITDSVVNAAKKIQLLKNDKPFATIKLDGSGTVNYAAATLLNKNDVISAAITRNATGTYSIDASMIDIAYPSYTIYELNRPAGLTITGLIDPVSAFNIEFSPKRNLLRHGGWIRSFVDHNDTGLIKFQSSAKNGELSTHLVNIIADVTVTEKTDEIIGSFLDKMFTLQYISFKCALPYNIIDVVKQNPYGVISYHWKGQKRQGFVIDIAHKPATREEQTVRLLSSPNSDLTTLIDVD